MTTPMDQTLDTCGCCEGVQELTPVALDNRPGLSAIAYRIGVHSTFKTTMIAALSRQAALRGLTTRADDDTSIALIDAWATVADVLTFYQERIANEGYLRTATERRSVLELAREIGYELSPGVAASTFLAFTVEDAPGQLAAATAAQTGSPQAASSVEDDSAAPTTVTIPIGTKVQSIPAQGKLPQTFETVEAIEARAEWNVLRPRLTQPQTLAIQDGRLQLIGVDGAHVPGNQLYLIGTSANLKVGDLLLVVVGSKTLPVTVRRVTAEPNKNRTRIDLVANPSVNPSLPPFAPPHWPPVYDPPPAVAPATLPLTDANLKAYILQRAWREADLSAFLTMQGWSPRRVARSVNSLLQGTTHGLVHAFRARLGFFGHNAPAYNSLPSADTGQLRGDAYPNDWDGPGGWEIWKDPNKINFIIFRQPRFTVAANEMAATAFTGSAVSGINRAAIGDIVRTSPGIFYFNPYWDDADVYLERSVQGLLSGGWGVFELPTADYSIYRVAAVNETSLSAFSMSGKANGLRLTNPDGSDPNRRSDLTVRRATAHVQSESLPLAELPILDTVEPTDRGIMLDRLALGLRVGQTLLLSGERADLPGVTTSESVTLSEIVHQRGYTTLYFQAQLQNRYVRKTVAFAANVARATHGETVREALGSGDGSQPNQRFTLRRPPLTYVSAPTASGGKSTLEVRVNGLLWQEVASLYGLSPRSESYIVRLDDDAKATVIFGDGKSGARLPTGAENVAATYRTGIGPDGEVKAGSLTLLQTRPLGVRGVTNPLAASGAQAPEQLADARANAPRTALTLDRIVSVRDFENFARAFAGIGKAQAVVLWDGQTQLVNVTVASASGGPVDPQSDLYKNLVKAMNNARDPYQRLDVHSFIPRTFSLDAGLLVDARAVSADVFAAANAILAAFAFSQRSFGQPVTAAEITATLQGVPGVVAVDLNSLTLDNAANVGPQPAPILRAAPSRVGAGAELLLVNPNGVRLKEMTS